MSPISPSEEPVCFRSPTDLIESARKSQSLPPLYTRPKSPSATCSPGNYAYLNNAGSPASHVPRYFDHRLESPHRKTNNAKSSRISTSHSRLQENFQTSAQPHFNNHSQTPHLQSPLISDHPDSHGCYFLTTDSGKVIKMSPSGSLGRDVSGNNRWNRQFERGPKFTSNGQLTPCKLTSMSQNSLIYSGLSGNSESAYGSINSSLRSASALDRSSSMETLSRKEKREAMKLRMERIRGKEYSCSSSEEDYPSVSSSQHGSESSLNISDSKRRSRASRTERYLRRKAMELETLRTASEKDRKSKEAVQARILEMQKKQKSNKGKTNGYQNGQKEHFTSENIIGSHQKTKKLIFDSLRYLQLGRYSAKSSSVPPSNILQYNQSNVGVRVHSPPAPPRRHDSFLSPGINRPISYSFEGMDRHALSPFGNDESFDNTSSLYSSSHNRFAGRNSDYNIGYVSQVPANYNGLYRNNSSSTGPPSIPPSPSSDYASYVSDNSARNCRPLTPSVDYGDVWVPSHMIKKVTIPPRDILCPSSRINIQQNSTNLKSHAIGPVGSNIPFPSPFKEKVLKSNLSQNSIAAYNYPNFENQENTTNPQLKPDPPVRTSSSIAKCHKNYLKQQLDFLKSNKESQEKLKQFLLKEKNRLQLSKRADFKAAMIELEAIYESLNLDSEDIMEGAEKREKEELLKLQRDECDSRKSKFHRKRSPSPDILKDDLHLRRTRSIDSIHPDVLVAGLSGSYLLTSPVFAPTSPESAFIGKSEPDVIKDDASLRTIQMANAIKVIDPQPPFGIPLRPVSQGQRSDYLHSSPISPRRNIASSLPGIMTDDLAYRCLRKDPAAEKTDRARSLDLDQLNMMFSTDQDSDDAELHFTSPSPEKSMLPYPINASRRCSSNKPNNKSMKKCYTRGRRFSDSYKGISLLDLERLRKSRPSWIERAQLSDDTLDSMNITSTETLIGEMDVAQPNSSTNIRQSIVNHSRHPSAGPKDDSDESDYEFMNRKAKIAPELVQVRSLSTSPIAHAHIISPLKCNGPVFNNVPKPFYLKSVGPSTDISLVNVPQSTNGNSESIKTNGKLHKTSIKRRNSKTRTKKSSSPRTIKKNQINDQLTTESFTTPSSSLTAPVQDVNNMEKEKDKQHFKELSG